MQDDLNITATNSSKKRIWEIDFLRGFAVLTMAFDHFCWDLGFVFRTIYTNPTLKKICSWAHDYILSDTKKIINFIFCVGIFAFVSGISSTLSRSNFKRGLKVLSIALALTVGSYLLGIIAEKLHFESMGNLVIYYGIFHAIGTMMILSPAFLKIKKNYVLIVLGILFIAMGILFQSFVRTETITPLIIFNILPKWGFATPDFVPLIPLLGVYLLGMVFGRKFYKNKTSLIKKELKPNFINFLGRHTLPIYFIHQIIILLILMLGLLIK